MAKIIMYDNGNGVSIVSPAPGVDIKEVIAVSVPKKADYKIMDAAQLPQSREYRDAWTMDGVDVKKAKEIHLNKIRPVRDAKLKELDIEWMRAIENGESKLAGDIAAKKQKLRDVTERKDFKSIKKIEDIERFWPEILEG